jgi:maltose O-acetyltransferase
MSKFIFKTLKKISSKMKIGFYTTHFLHGPPERLTIGKNVALANTLFNTRSGKIVIGDGVIFGHNVMVLAGVHDMHLKGSEKRRTTLEDDARDIYIKDGAWIASGVIITGPVTIGENTVIGAGSVVAKDIPDGVLAVGNPAKVVKRIDFK